MTDDQIRELLDTGAVEGINRMQIDDDDSNQFETLESDSDDDDGPFSFQKKTSWLLSTGHAKTAQNKSKY